MNHADRPRTPRDPAQHFDTIIAQTLLRRCPTAAVLIDHQGAILHVHGDASPYLELPASKPHSDLFELLRKPLRAKLRAALKKALETGAMTAVVTPRPSRRGLRAATPPTTMTVIPVTESQPFEGLLLVTFEPAPPDGDEPLAMNEDGAGDGLESLIDLAEVAVLVLGADGAIRRFTPPAQRLLGLVPADLGRPIGEHADQRVTGGLLDDAAAALGTGQAVEREVESRDLRVLLRRVVSRAGDRGAGTVVTFTDVTALTRSMAKARLFATIVTESNDAIIVQDLAGQVGAWNRGARQMYGHEEAEMIGASARLLMSAKGWERHLAILERLRRRDTIDAYEAVRQTKDGRRLDVWVTATVVTDERGQPTAVAVTERDITERKRLESRLARFSETAVDGNVIIDERGIIESVNPAVERIFGHPAAALVGQNVGMLMPEPSHHEHAAFLDAYLATGEKKVIGVGREVVGRRADGRPVPIFLSVSEMQLGGRRVFSGIVHDLTVVTELRARATRVQHLAQIGEMSASIAHEIKNPLAGISGVIQVIRQRIAADDPTQHVLDTVRDNIARIDRVVRDLMAFSKSWKPRKVPTNVGEVARRVAEGFEVVARTNGLRLRVIAPGSAPIGRLDPDHLHLILLNLVGNACEATPPGGEVRVFFSESPQAITVGVSDNGPGIPPEMKPFIFKPFHTSKVHGTGLGLATCQRIMEAHGGSIELSGGDGDGTTLTLTFPRDSNGDA